MELPFVTILSMLRPGVLVEVLPVAMLVLVSPRGLLVVLFITVLFMQLPGGLVQSQLEVLFIAMLFMQLPGGLVRSLPFHRAMVFPLFLAARSHRHGGPLH